MPAPGPNQVLIKVAACGVCRTDLHIVDGELPQPKLPLVLGHEIVGHVEALGRRRRGLRASASASACRGSARPTARAPIAARAARISATTRASPATRSTAAMPNTPSPTRATCFRSPDGYSDAEAAPLLCAGLIGYRSLKLAGPGEAPRHLRLRRGRAYRGAGGARTRAARSTPSRGPATPRHKTSRCEPRRGVGRRLGRDAARAARCRDHLRPGRRARAGGAPGRAQRRRGGVRRHPYERHPELPLRDPVGGARASARSPI